MVSYGWMLDMATLVAVGTNISILRSSVHERPVGFEPVGTVYKTRGLGFSLGQFSRTCSTSVGFSPSTSE
jgi:hypothetical protein